MHNHQEVVLGERSDGSQVALWIVAQLKQRGRHGDWQVGGEEQRVAIGRSPYHRLRADGSRCPDPVFHHNRLVPSLRKLLTVSRAKTSDGPPAGNGTRKRTGRE